MDRAAFELAGTAERRQPAAVDQGDAIAIFGFVHVMRGDDDADALARERVDEVPEAAARLRIDARSRLVEEQDRRLVQHGAAERETLLPTAREVGNERIPPASEARHVDGEFEPLVRDARL